MSPGTSTGFLVNSSGAPTINVGSGATENVSATGGPAVDVRNANSASSLTFDAVSSTNSSGAAINLDSNGAAPFSASSGSISGAAGNAIDVNGGAGDVTYPGTLGNGAGGTADITGRTGGAISLSGDINDTNDAGGGITMSGNTGGSTTFSGTTKTLNTGAPAAFSSTRSGHTITFSGGGLNIDTTSGAGFSATGGGTVNVTGTVNTIDTTTGTGLNVSSTNIGASGLTFEHISSSGAASGIVLNSTGSSGGLTVTGTGSAGTGGTIANATGSSVVLTSTTSPSLSWMNITDSAGGASDEGIAATNVGGTVTLDHLAITNAPHNGINVDNVNVNMTAFNLSNTTIQCNTGNACEPAGSVGNDGLLLRMRGTSVLGSGSVTSSTFSGVRATGVQIFAQDTARIGSSSGGAIVSPAASNSFTISGSTISNDGNAIDFSQAQVANFA